MIGSIALKILYVISPIGLGHAARSIAIALELNKMGYDITFASSAKVCKFLNLYGFNCMIVHNNIPDFHISRKGELKRTLIWMIKYILFYKRMKKIARKIINNWDVVISDEEFAFGNEAVEANKKLVFISDLLVTNFATNRFSRIIENRTNRWFLEFFKRVPLVIALEDYFPDYPNIKKIYPIVRETSRTRDEIRSSLGIKPSEKVILISAGGGFAGDFIYRYSIQALNSINIDDSLILIVGGEKYCDAIESNSTCLPYYRDMHELIYASDLVITTAGKTTIDECLVYGTPFIAIPIKNHYEQERNARKYGFRYEDIYRLKELIQSKINSGRMNHVENKVKDAVREITRYLEE